MDSSIHNPQSTIRILINAGPTREYFDSVRFISNPSSGKQGFAIARAVAARGHRVTLVAGPVDLPDVAGAKMIRVGTAAEMAEACKREFEHCDAAILTAAVCDYRPAERQTHKLEKSAEQLRITLEPTEDIAAALGRIKGRRILIGFAMDDHDAHSKAERKLADKNCDYMVANGPKNIGSDHAAVTILSKPNGWCEPITGTKDSIAEHLISVLESSSARQRGLAGS